MGEPLNAARVGIVGLGNISRQYLSTLSRLNALRVAAVADLDHSRAEAIARTHEVRALTVDDLLVADDVDVLLNLTTPASHGEVALKAIAAGKWIYGEKPLATTLRDAHAVMATASQAEVRVGCAPDTVLGTGVQTARKAIDDGHIGAPRSATAMMMVPGHEHWHPNPDFYYQQGGGPLLDMGPYYITALIHLLGPVESVVGMASRPQPSRTIHSGPRAGEVIPVHVDTHVVGILRHASGAISTLVMSFDAVGTRSRSIEVHGDLGSMSVPDPNTFSGEVSLLALESKQWVSVPPSAGYRDASRGFGLADMVAGEHDRATGQVALHVLEVMLGILGAGRTGAAIAITSTCNPGPTVPLQDAPGGLRRSWRGS